MDFNSFIMRAAGGTGTSKVADASQWGKNISTTATETLFWLAGGVLAFICVKFVLKKNYAGLVGAIAIGGLALVIIKDPHKLVPVGNAIWKAIFG